MGERRLSSEERRAQIVRISAQLFSKKGFKGTTTKEISKKVGISEAAIFHYFPTKNDLYTAIIKDRVGEEDDLFLPVEAMRQSDDVKVFGDLADYLLEKNEGDPTFMRLLLFSILEEHKLSDIFFQTHIRKKVQFLSEYIEQRIADGAFREVSPFLVARGFLGMIVQYMMGQEVFWKTKEFRSSRKEVVETFVKTFLQGIKKE
ncbi:MAG: TetR/AcrR family transcriptional regulator [Thermodesulfobacteriota bacterium]|nr:TetR/AcrR family transcriptional regulator [Thermodesulfobacteriota bacterium]